MLYRDSDAIKGIHLEDDKTVFSYSQDKASIESILKKNKQDRSEKQKGDLWLAARIPMEVVVDLYNRGLSIGNKNDWPKIRTLLNTEYKYLKTIDGEI